MSSRHLTFGTLSHPQRTGDVSPLYILYIHIVYNLNTVVKGFLSVIFSISPEFGRRNCTKNKRNNMSDFA